MRLVRFGLAGEERLGIVDGAGVVRALPEDLGRDGELSFGLRDRLNSLDVGGLEPVSEAVRLGPCVGRVGKIVAVGLNYRRHAAEAGAAEPAEPVLFTKATTALCGPYDDVLMPPHARKVDWEVELAVVIGERTKTVSESEALDRVFGYAVMNDVSDRGLQLEGTGQWVKGKSLDTFAPLGPWLVTADEVPDPQDLRLWLKVNGQTMQDASTADMIFPVAHLVSYISRHMTLLPGDVIATGTPHGVGMGLRPPRYLEDGDVLELGIDRLGQQRQVARRTA